MVSPDGGRGGYAALIAKAEAAPPGSLGVQFLPHLRQASPPHVDVQAQGPFIGLSTDVTRRALFRAVLEGVAFASRNTLEPQLAYANLDRLHSIYAISGGTRNLLPMRLKAAVFNQPMTVVGVEEATALDAAMLAGMGAGVYADHEESAAARRIRAAGRKYYPPDQPP